MTVEAIRLVVRITEVNVLAEFFLFGKIGKRKKAEGALNTYIHTEEKRQNLKK